MNSKAKTIGNQRLITILVVAASLLLIPLIAMQCSHEVDWKLADFVIMGILLNGIGLACELVLRKVSKPAWRIVVCAAILLAFLLVWAELAVGIFGTPFAGC